MATLVIFHLPPPKKGLDMKQYEGDGYKQQLLKMREEGRARQAERDAKQEEIPPLAAQIRRWWSSLDDGEKQAFYRMEFFTEKFQAAPRLIGPVLLLELGWRRQRVFAPERPHYRVWCPPARTD